MDDAKDDVSYTANSEAQDVHRDKPYANGYGEGEEENDEEAAVEMEEEDDDEEEDANGVQRIRKSDVNNGRGMEGDDSVEGIGYKGKNEEIDFYRHPKKRRSKSIVSNYEFAPRVAHAQTQPATDINNVSTTSAHPASATNKQSIGGRNALADWTEHETFVLLDAWGDRFLQHGRKSLRFEEWQEVAEKVSQESKIERTDTQCRNRLDTLKKKFKKEMSMFGPTTGRSSSWIYFKKMDSLMSPPTKQPGLSCAIDSREHVFSNPRVYLNHANGLDEMRNYAGHSDSTEDDSDGLPPTRKMPSRIVNSNNHTLKEKRHHPMNFLADSLLSFINTYERVENSKRQQLVELEKMRIDFLRDLEHEKKLILEKAQAEIAKIWQGDNDGNGASLENIGS